MEDRTLLSMFVITNTGDSGAGSLRQAILDSNAAIGPPNTLDFDVPGSGVEVITPLSPLPAITNPVLIDGFSQPGYSGAPLIELNGSQAGSASGLMITGYDVTVRGLDINGFANGAGILITGSTAWGNAIEANDIGADPTGSQALPDGYGVEILDGAFDNTVGGTTAADGNLIAFNEGPGVTVASAFSFGDQITANQIVSNDNNRGGLQFDGSSYVSLPIDLLQRFPQEETIEASFKTTSGGVILGDQGASPGDPLFFGWVPALYVGTDGKLYGDLGNLSQAVSNGSVNDGQWHSVALVADAASDTLRLYLDGQLVGRGSSGTPNSVTSSTRSGPDTRTAGRPRRGGGMASWGRWPMCESGASPCRPARSSKI